MKRHALVFALVAAAIASPLAETPTKAPVGPPAAATTPERGIGSGVTEKIAPPGPPPPKCNVAYNGKFGIAVQNITMNRQNVVPAASPAILPVPTQVRPGLAPAETTPPPLADVGPDSPPPPPDEGIAITKQSTRTHTRTVTVRRTVVGQEMRQSVYMISQIGDGQIQAPTTPIVLQRTIFAAPLPAAATPGSPKTVGSGTGSGLVSEIGDGQIQAPKPAVAPPAAPPAAAPPAAMPPMAGMNMKRDAPPENPATQFVACMTPGTLSMTLADGVLKDDKGRTGYIASNYQFQ